MIPEDDELDGFSLNDLDDKEDEIEKGISPDYEDYLHEEELYQVDDDDENDFYEDLDGWDSPFRWDDD